MISKTSKVRYALGMFGTSIPINMVKTFAPIYYIDQLGVTASQFSTVIAVTAIADIFFIYMLGKMSDQFINKMKRSIWMIFGAPILVLLFILFFSNGFLQNQSTIFIYLLILYLAIAIVDGMININYGALFPELFKSEKERMITNSYRQIFQLLAMVLSIALTPLLVSWMGYSYVSVLYGIITLIVILYSAFGNHESIEKPAITDQKEGSISELFTILKDSLLWFYGISILCYSVAFSLITQGIPFYVQYTLEALPMMNSVYLGSIFIVTIISILFTGKYLITVKIEKIWLYSYILILFGFLISIIFTTESALFISSIALGAGIGLMMTSSDIIGTKVIDIDYKTYKVVRTGLYMSVYNIMFRLNGLVVGVAFFLSEYLFGFVNGDEPGGTPDIASSFLFLYFPFIIIILGTVFSGLFNKKVSKLNF